MRFIFLWNLFYETWTWNTNFLSSVFLLLIKFYKDFVCGLCRFITTISVTQMKNPIHNRLKLWYHRHVFINNFKFFEIWRLKIVLMTPLISLSFSLSLTRELYLVYPSNNAVYSLILLFQYHIFQFLFFFFWKTYCFLKIVCQSIGWNWKKCTPWIYTSNMFSLYR